ATTAHLAGVVDIERLGIPADRTLAQVDHEIVAPVQVAFPEPRAALRGDEKRMEGHIPGEVRGADHLAQVVDAVGVTVVSTQRAQVDQRAIVPEGGMAPGVLEGGVTHNLAGFVEIGGGERAEVYD